jgi:hypothetical protein
MFGAVLIKTHRATKQPAESGDSSTGTEHKTARHGLSKFLRAALLYLQLGWPLFPLIGKRPLTLHGFKDASLDEKQIREWGRKYPNANIGVPTGVRFWAFDVDPRHGGDESLEHLIYAHGALTNSLQQTTGGGGEQYLFAMPDQQEIRCHIGLWPGIDIKGLGGYILVPPSIHPSPVSHTPVTGPSRSRSRSFSRRPHGCWRRSRPRAMEKRTNG